MSHDTRRLRDLLGPWKTPRLDYPGGFRFHDAPPEVVRRALAMVDPFHTTSRPNGQPPAGWLVDTAERLGGLLAGQVADDEGRPEQLRIDALCVAAQQAEALARAVDEDWPEPAFGELALDLALAEGWQAWDAETPIWTANGREALSGVPSGVVVVGLWWD